MKIGVIGAGITGLSIGKLLSDQNEVDILEANATYGGIARTKNINGVAYHTTGGHCLNSKNNNVLKFIFQEIMGLDQWNKIDRNSEIILNDMTISYPIEYALKEIYKYDKQLAFEMTVDFFEHKTDNPKNLYEWFTLTFGKSLAENYFIPYNEKIWQFDLKKIDLQWLKEKLPQPIKRDVFDSLLQKKQDDMVHKFFYYPLSNNQNSFLDAMAYKQHIILNYRVEKIEKKLNKWVINGEREYDILINTSPLDKFPSFIIGTPPHIQVAAKKLKKNGITTVLWESHPTKATWTYIPDKNNKIHRQIHIGNFFTPNQNYTITESIGLVSYKEMKVHGLKLKNLIEPIAYNHTEYAYVLFDFNHKISTTTLKDYLAEIGIYNIGRFAEWEYYNMDICIEKSLELKNHLRKERIC